MPATRKACSVCAAVLRAKSCESELVAFAPGICGSEMVFWQKLVFGLFILTPFAVLGCFIVVIAPAMLICFGEKEPSHQVSAFPATACSAEVLMRSRLQVTIVGAAVTVAATVAWLLYLVFWIVHESEAEPYSNMDVAAVGSPGTAARWVITLGALVCCGMPTLGECAPAVTELFRRR